MSTVTRDEFATVKELLLTAAQYVASVHRKLDQVGIAEYVRQSTPF